MTRFPSTLQSSTFVNILSGVISLLVLTSLAWLWPLKIRMQVKTVEDESAQIEASMSNAVQTIQRLAEIKQEIQELEHRVDAIQARIPEGRDEEGFLEELSKTALNEKISIVDYRRGRVLVLEQFATLTIAIRLEGSYAATCRFLEKLRHLDRLTCVEQLQILTNRDTNRYPVQLSIGLFYQPKPQTVDRRVYDSTTLQ